DIFSAGVVLWNALTGKKLFHGPTEHASMFNVLKRRVPRPSRVGLRPPTFLDGIVMKALERDARRRFQSAEEMAIALRDASIRAGCLGAPSEIAELVSSSFGPELDARRRKLREVAGKPRNEWKIERMEGDRPSLASFAPLSSNSGLASLTSLAPGLPGLGGH